MVKPSKFHPKLLKIRMFGNQSTGICAYTLWLCQVIAIENGPVEIVEFPIISMVDLSIAMAIYQRVNVSKLI